MIIIDIIISIMIKKINKQFRQKKNLIYKILISNNFLLFFLLLIIFLYPFFNRPQENIYILGSVIDNIIPLVPFFSILYLLYFPWLFINIFLAWYRKNNFKPLAYSLIIINVIAYLIYLTLQTHVTREVIISQDFFSQILRFIYNHDHPYNCFPSLHSALSASLASYYLITNSKNKYINVVIAILIIISTLFVKQHYVADVIFGSFLGIFITWLIFLKSKNQN